MQGFLSRKKKGSTTPKARSALLSMLVGHVPRSFVLRRFAFARGGGQRDRLGGRHGPGRGGGDERGLVCTKGGPQQQWGPVGRCFLLVVFKEIDV